MLPVPLPVVAGAVAAGAVLVVVVVVVATVVGRARPGPVEDRIPMVSDVATVSEAAAPTVTEPYVHVHVAGAVVRPGLYRLAAGARVADAVTAAGGFAPSADPDRLNLAATLADGAQVAVPRVGEPVSGGDVTGGISGQVQSGDGGPVDINSAGSEELQRLPGIGPSRADAIIAHREEFGPFSSVDDLADVPGIGPATLEGLRDAARV